MKNILLFLLCIYSAHSSRAQTNVYHPFPDSSAEWRDINALCDDPVTLPVWVWDYHYWLCGDTVINSLLYHKLCSEYTYDEEYYYWSNVIGSYWYNGPSLTMAIREDSLRRIYLFDFFHQADTLLYDFGNLYVGASLPLTYINTDSFAYISAIDSVLIGSSYRKAYRISDSTLNCAPPPPFLIEGVGFSSGLLQPRPCHLGTRNFLICYSQNSQLLYSHFFTQFHTCGTMLPAGEYDDVKDITLFPNPASGTFTIQNNSGSKNAEVEIYNLLSEKIYSSGIERKQHIVDLKLLPGIYIVKVKVGEKQFVQKLISE